MAVLKVLLVWALAKQIGAVIFAGLNWGRSRCRYSLFHRQKPARFAALSNPTSNANGG